MAAAMQAMAETEAPPALEANAAGVVEHAAVVVQAGTAVPVQVREAEPLVPVTVSMEVDATPTGAVNNQAVGHARKKLHQTAMNSGIKATPSDSVEIGRSQVLSYVLFS